MQESRTERREHSSPEQIAEQYVRAEFRFTDRIVTCAAELLDFPLPKPDPVLFEMRVAALSSALTPFFEDPNSFDFNSYFELKEAVQNGYELELSDKTEAVLYEGRTLESAIGRENADEAKRVGKEASKDLIPTINSVEKMKGMIEFRKVLFELAEERGRTEAEILADQDGHDELVRRTETPASFLHEVNMLTDGFGEEIVKTQALAALESVKQAMRDSLPEEFRELAIMEQLINSSLDPNNPKFLEAIEEWGRKIEQVFGYAVRSELVRIWGPEGFDSLTLDLRDKLLRL